jgi:ferredoxin-type protein NapH
MDVSEVYDRKGGDVTVSNCILCMRCVEMCPYPDTLEAKFAGKTVMRSRDWLEEKS